MKKLALFFLMMIFAVSLAACNNLPDEVNTCLENPNAEGCPVICPEGQELDVESATCVTIDEEEDPLVCPAGQHIESEVCVVDDTRTQQQIITDFIVDGFNSDESITFLSTTMALMDFSEAMSVTTDISFEVTEDINETHSFDGQFIDSYIEDETNGNMMQRQIMIDVDNDMNLDFTVIYHEVEGGVHVYINVQSLLDSLTEEDPDAADVLGWVGFDQPWAVFEFDDSLEAIIQVEVLKDMLVELFFSEMGETYFSELQVDMEDNFDFGLTQYGLNLGLLIDTLIEEDYTAAQTMLDAIDFDGIALHYDALHIAPALYRILTDTENGLVGKLGMAGMDVSSEHLELLDTATFVDYVSDDQNTPEYDPVYSHYELNGLSVDPLKGTKAFLDSLDTDDIDALVEVLIQPAIYNRLENELEDAIDYELSEDEVVAWLTDHNDELVAMGYLQADLDQWLIDIDSNGLQTWFYSLDEDVLDLALQQEVYARIDEFTLAVDDGEGAEWIVNEIFTNPHTTQALLDMGIEQDVIDDVIAANFISIDFDALALETLDLELLGNAIYDGTVAYDTYLTALQLTAPNYAAILEVFAPGVSSLAPHMAYVDDMMYAFDGLDVFEDYIDLSYYMEDIFDVEVTATEDFEILTTFDIDGLAYATLFSDLTTDLGVYLGGFESIDDYPYDDEFVCLDSEDMYCDDLDLYINRLVAVLTTLESSEGYMLMDPMNPDGFELGLDFTALFNALVEDEYDFTSSEEGYTPDADNNDLTGVTDLSITITVVDEATITLPAETVTTDVNMVIQDVAKYQMTMHAYEYLNDIVYAYMNGDLFDLAVLFNTDVFLTDVPDVDFSAAFDLDMSYVSLSAEINLLTQFPDLDTADYEIVLYWLDGTLVFDSPVGLSEVAAFMVDGDLLSGTAYQTMVDRVNDDNWHTSKLFGVYLLENSYDMKNVPN